MSIINIFKKKNEREILEKKYRDMLKEAHTLSKYSRRKSDAKYAEADQLMKEIEAYDLHNKKL